MVASFHTAQHELLTEKLLTLTSKSASRQGPPSAWARITRLASGTSAKTDRKQATVDPPASSRRLPAEKQPEFHRRKAKDDSQSSSQAASGVPKAVASRVIPKVKRPKGLGARRRTFASAMKPALIWGPALTLALAAIGCLIYFGVTRWTAKPVIAPAPSPNANSTPVLSPENTTNQLEPPSNVTTQAFNSQASANPRPWVYGYRIKNRFQHDSSAFTQGLVYWGKDASGNDILYESTGLYGQSTMRRVILQTGKVVAVTNNGAGEFGEGIAFVENRTKLLQVTWLTQDANVFSVPDLKKDGVRKHGMTDGWGLTEAGDGNLYGSDGTAFLYKLSADDLSVMRKVKVMDGSKAINQLNELERVDGTVWANVWQTPCIAQINEKSGKVLSWIYLQGLVKEVQNSGLNVDVLNGIAWDSTGRRLFVTGKQWPTIFEISLVKATPKNPAAYLKKVRAKCWPQ